MLITSNINTNYILLLLLLYNYYSMCMD